MEIAHRNHSQALFTYLRGLNRHEPQLAEDLLQETMLKAWRHRDSLPVEDERARRWLFTIARNITIDSVRSRKAKPAEVRLADAGDAAGGEFMDYTLSLQAMRAAFEQLSPMQRTVLHELYVEGRAADEVAVRLGVPVGTVKSRAFYALRAVRKAMA
ncbi:RNA polymerase sigma factor [Actinoplanes cyaneus]|uniref:RNA polymerase sigma factor n=2 Tax=Actinoplanes cyaneus TaxID=52696 RepID=A0A919INZ3_9ACTN|nr:RNA polymerase sigma-70 factor, ECF subfamily [Actinoplanes cyaneus]GID68216.1 RNA polymerase sigma factor [Actinoplanes cyaneus]